VQLGFQDQDFSWKFLLADVAFPILGEDFLRAHKLLIDPKGHALLDSTGRRLTGQLRSSPPTAMVVVSFVQLYKPVAEKTSSLAHTARPDSARAASAGPVSSSAHKTRPASKQNPSQLKAAYSRLLGEISDGGVHFKAHTAGQPRCYPPHRHTWAAHRFQISEVGW
jgi:hypothetical protein